MADKHLKLQKRMMDIFYENEGKSRLPDEIEQHLESCEQCRVFWSGLYKIDGEISSPEIRSATDTEPDNRIIKAAFRQANTIQEKRKSLSDFMLFILLAAAVLSVIGLFVAKGYGAAIIIAQVVIMIAAPILVPFIIGSRLAKEDR